MRNLSASVRLLLIPLGAIGCASVNGGRTGVAPQIRTITAVGDRPMPAVAGAPGDSVASDRVVPDNRPSASGRISGRVVDAEGKPVPNARVRLAVGGASGGRVVRAKTDPAGGFTLNGLRPETRYTVIAELEDEHGVLTGRKVVQAPDREVKIVVHDFDDSGPESSSAKVDRVSESAERSEEEPAEASPDRDPPLRVNDEDIPPASEADDPELDDPAPSVRSGRSTGWHHGETSSRDDPATDQMAARHPTRLEGEAQSEDVSGPSDIEGERNPLPPAIEPGRAPQPSRLDSADDQAVATAAPPESAEPTTRKDDRPPPIEPAEPVADKPAPPEISPEPVAPPPTLAELPTPSPAPTNPLPESPPPVAATAPTEPAPATTTEAAPSLIPDATPSPVAPSEAPAPAHDPASNPQPEPVTEHPLDAAQVPPTEPTPTPVVEPAPAATTEPNPTPSPASEATAEQVSTPPTRRLTWGELTASSPPRLSLANPRRSSATGGGGSAVYCRFDPKNERIVDFRLPDLQGRPVRFQDLDADLILIDFWGTWCSPCLESIPHLVALQKRLGPDRFKVVGIAYEEGPTEDRAAGVGETASRLGINYPVLLGTMDGRPCPLQSALHVTAYPTMILVDRQGNIRWRGEGSSARTLAKLDRVVAVNTSNASFTRR